MTYQKNNQKEQGAAVLIFLMIMAIFVSLLSALTYSRLLVSIKRSLSQADAVVTNYTSESKVNDILARLKGGYIGAGSFPFTFNETQDGTRLQITGTQLGNTQTITVTGERSYAVSRIEATRVINNVSDVDQVDMILSIDCTGSMDAYAGTNCPTCTRPTRFDSAKEAALSFIDRLITINSEPTYAGKFNLGVQVFGIDSKWLRSSGRNITPGSMSLEEVRVAVESGFGSTRAGSSACTGVMDATSIGSAFITSQEYFAANKPPKTKQVEIVITDGEPNSRAPYGACSPAVFCPAFPKSSAGEEYCESNEYGWTCHNYSSYKDGPYDSDNFNQAAYSTCEPLGRDFLSCAIADTDTNIPPLSPGGVLRPGVRDPEIDAYAVTIFANPPQNVVNIFTSYLSASGYYNATRATQLKNILNTVLNEILRDRTTITIKRTPPTL